MFLNETSLDGRRLLVYLSDHASGSIPLSFAEPLYSSLAHLATQSDQAIFSFYLIRDSATNASAVFRCAEPCPSHFTAPARAPFGGIDCEKDCSVAELSFLLSTVVDWVRRQRAVTLEVKSAPACYQPDLHPKLHDAYLGSGFTVSHVHKNWHIPVGKDFGKHLYNAAARRLRKAERSGLRPGLPPEFSAADAFAFIKKCRDQKNYPLTISPIQFGRLANQFADKTCLFGVLDGEKLAALAFVVKPTADAAYNYLTDYDAAYRTCSPAIMLTSQIYDMCLQNSISILDLGISLDHHGNFKPSLARFKERIGGVVSEKITYRIDF